MAEEVTETNRAPDHPTVRVTDNRDSHSWHIVLNKYVLLLGLLALSGIVNAYMFVEMRKANETISTQRDTIEVFQKEVESLKTNQRGCDESKYCCGREKQENDKLKQTTKSQSDIIASVKEAKERESGMREYVQNYAKDCNTKLNEMQSKFDHAKYDYGKVKQENEKLTQEIEILKDKVFGANEELDVCTNENRWHWVFTWIVIGIILLFCCFVVYFVGAEQGAEQPNRKRIAY